MMRRLNFNNSRHLCKAGAILVLAASAFFCTLPFFIHKTLFVSHDIKFHLFQSHQFYKSLASGTLMPRWAIDANNGYGSPNFLFYSPFSYYIVSLFHFFLPSIIGSIIAAIWSSFLFSGISMYFVVKRYAGAAIGLICAVLYQIFPFHTIDLYMRGTLGELFAFVWFPLLFVCLDEILSFNRKRLFFVGFSICYAGLILTHLVSAFLFAMIFITYLLLIAMKGCCIRLDSAVGGILRSLRPPSLCCSKLLSLRPTNSPSGFGKHRLWPLHFSERNNETGQSISLLISSTAIFRYKNIATSLLSFFFGMCLAAYFLLPIPFELKYVKIDYIYTYPFSNYKKNFLLSYDILYELLVTGQIVNNMMVLLDIVVILELTLFIIILIPMPGIKKSILENGLTFFSVYVVLLSIFMATPLSKWLWNISPQISTTQFPWRWVAYLEVALVFMAASMLKEARGGLFWGTAKYRWSLYLIVSLLLISVPSIFYRNHELSLDIINRMIHPETYDYDKDLPREYTPQWVSNLDEILVSPPPDPVSVLSGTAFARTISWQPEKRVFEVDARTPAVLRIATTYYPGWTAESGGRNIDIIAEKKTGTMLIGLDKGRHSVSLSFGDTPLRRAAKYVSLISCLTLSLYTIGRRSRNGSFP